jgi:hypothetical protein
VPAETPAPTPSDTERRIAAGELIDRTQVAEIIKLGNPDGLSVYRRRYSDFPAPFIERGRAAFWVRADVEAWATERGRT